LTTRTAEAQQFDVANLPAEEAALPDLVFIKPTFGAYQSRYFSRLGPP
jgi:hypothetical protein